MVSRFISRVKNTGPGAFVVAAFIGPGTVTACTLAGANYGFALLWAILFATVATIILQEMSARLGVVAQVGLGEALRHALKDSGWRWGFFGLIVVAIYLGNSAYEAGNLTGAALGLNAAIGDGDSNVALPVLIISALSAALVWLGSYRHIEKLLIVLVLFMALAFITTFIIVGPSPRALLRGMFVPTIPDGALLTTIALIGTTVVPYNLFLHAATARKKWHSGAASLSDARADTIMSVSLGGLITLLIVSTAAASFFEQAITVNSAADMARQLEPTFGAFSKYVLGAGFFAAGLSSAITAPLATAYVVQELFGDAGDDSSRMFRGVALSVIVVGAVLSLTGIRPVNVILAAQFANGLLLPVIAIFLLYAMNQKDLLGKYTNGKWSNALGILVIAVTAILGFRLIAGAIQSL